MSGDEVFEFMLKYATSDTDSAEFFGSNVDFADSAEWRDGLGDRLINHLVWEAYQRGSSDAANEIGAAQIYCYQGTKQNVEAAIPALEKAASKNDPLAMMTLGKIYYQGLDGNFDKEKGKILQDKAFDLTVRDLIEARKEISDINPE